MHSDAELWRRAFAENVAPGDTRLAVFGPASTAFAERRPNISARSGVMGSQTRAQLRADTRKGTTGEIVTKREQSIVIVKLNGVALPYVFSF